MKHRLADIKWVAGAILLSLAILPAHGQDVLGAATATSLEAEFEAAASSLMAKITQDCAPEAKAILGEERIGFGLQPAG
jgi:hypothetical protein